jgi:hypothetical protein
MANHDGGDVIFAPGFVRQSDQLLGALLSGPCLAENPGNLIVRELARQSVRAQKEGIALHNEFVANLNLDFRFNPNSPREQVLQVAGVVFISSGL